MCSKEPVIHVDLDDPRISATEGEPVFLPQGGNSRYLDRVAGILNGIRTGLEVSKAMFAAFTAADLIEPREARDQVQFRRAVRPARTAHDQSARSSPSSMPKPCTSCNRSGFLQGAFLVTSSLGNVQRLIEMKGRRRQRQAAMAS